MDQNYHWISSSFPNKKLDSLVVFDVKRAKYYNADGSPFYGRRHDLRWIGDCLVPTGHPTIEFQVYEVKNIGV